MGAFVSIARRVVEYPIAWLLCLTLFCKCMMDKIKNEYHKSQDGAMDQSEKPRGTREFQGNSINGRVVSESMTSILNQIMTDLTQPNIVIIGVYGSSTARKLNVVEKITRRVHRDNLFDVVVMARVMEKPDFRRIQGELGNMLGLQLQEKTLEGRAGLLCERIKMEEKILIILDDLWGGINLGRIGIPFGNDHKGCKILLVSHSQEVLSNQMNTQIEISV